MLALSLFNPEVMFGLGGLVLTFVVIPLVTWVSLRFGTRQWREVAEGRGETIHDLEKRVAVLDGAVEEKDKRITVLETMVRELGGQSVHDAVVKATDAILRAIEGHETRAETRARLAEERRQRAEEKMVGLIETVGHAIAALTREGK